MRFPVGSALSRAGGLASASGKVPAGAPACARAARGDGFAEGRVIIGSRLALGPAGPFEVALVEVIDDFAW